MKTKEQKRILIKELEKNPIISFACRKAGFARATYYRWIEENEKFSEATKKAIEKGVFSINDLAIAQLILLIRNANFAATKYWLSHRDPAFSEKLQIKEVLQELIGQNPDKRKLTDEEEALIKEAIRLDYAPQIDTPEKIRIVTINKPLSYSIANHGCSC